MSKFIQVDIVSAESEIFSGEATRVFATGLLGELEVAAGHAPLLTSLLPGPIKLRLKDGTEEIAYVTGGILEIQPGHVTVLADTVVRARDFNEMEAIKAREQAEQAMQDSHSRMDIARARAELVQAAGMLRAIQDLKKKGQYK
jgi:F-type H+-transporting ATPase subunit epsilon